MSHVRVESKGSFWFLDDERGQYARMPKREGPRWSPPDNDWGGPDAGPLEDLKWHPMNSWEIRTTEQVWFEDPNTGDGEFFEDPLLSPRLVIHVPPTQVDGRLADRVSAPDAKIVG